VTGANRGLGREIVSELAARGHIVILGARDLRKGHAVAAELGGRGLRVVARELDVTEHKTIDRLAASIDAQFARLDMLVNNAGIEDELPAPVVEADLEAVKKVLETNFFGAWRLAKAFVPLMRRNGYGRIVNVSSGMGQLASMRCSSPGYRVSKTALNALTRMLAAELAGTNILVNSVCPGWVRTDMGGRDAIRSVKEGADTPVWLATLPDGGPTGGFFRNRQLIPW
jgi:NAD(P)-dependent dehydrogenase (short-subunit alcohol dehydrogenase family)